MAVMGNRDNNVEDGIWYYKIDECKTRDVKEYPNSD